MRRTAWGGWANRQHCHVMSTRPTKLDCSRRNTIKFHQHLAKIMQPIKWDFTNSTSYEPLHQNGSFSNKVTSVASPQWDLQCPENGFQFCLTIVQWNNIDMIIWQGKSCGLFYPVSSSPLALQPFLCLSFFGGDMLVFGILVGFWRNIPILFCIYFHPLKFVGKDLPGESLTGTYGRENIIRIDLSVKIYRDRPT